MTRGISRKNLKHDEFVEKAGEAGHWLEEHWRTAAIVGGAVLLVVLGYALWSWNAARGRAAAETALASGLAHYGLAEKAGFTASGELDSALADLTTAAERGGGGAVGETARYFRAATLYRLGRSEEAVPLLERTIGSSSATMTLRGSATRLLATVYAQTDRVDEAVALLDDAISAEAPVVPPALALLQLGRIERGAGREDDARQTFQRLLDDYPQSAPAQEAQRLLGS